MAKDGWLNDDRGNGPRCRLRVKSWYWIDVPVFAISSHRTGSGVGSEEDMFDIAHRWSRYAINWTNLVQPISIWPCCRHFPSAIHGRPIPALLGSRLRHSVAATLRPPNVVCGVDGCMAVGSSESCLLISHYHQYRNLLWFHASYAPRPLQAAHEVSRLRDPTTSWSHWNDEISS